MHQKIIFYSFLIILFAGCAVNNSNLKSNVSFENNFTVHEINELEILFDFFNNKICPENENLILSKCYNQFFENIEIMKDSGEFSIPVDFNSQQFVYSKISDFTFNEIWTFGKYWETRDTLKTTYKTIYLNTNGKYFNFIKEVGQTDNFIKDYYEKVEASGDISPSLIAGILINYENLNIQDIRVQFIIAIHYMTLNDRYSRKEIFNKSN